MLSRLNGIRSAFKLIHSTAHTLFGAYLLFLLPFTFQICELFPIKGFGEKLWFGLDNTIEPVPFYYTIYHTLWSLQTPVAIMQLGIAGYLLMKDHILRILWSMPIGFGFVFFLIRIPYTNQTTMAEMTLVNTCFGCMLGYVMVKLSSVVFNQLNRRLFRPDTDLEKQEMRSILSRSTEYIRESLEAIVRTGNTKK